MRKIKIINSSNGFSELEVFYQNKVIAVARRLRSNGTPMVEKEWTLLHKPSQRKILGSDYYSMNPHELIRVANALSKVESLKSISNTYLTLSESSKRRIIDDCLKACSGIVINKKNEGDFLKHYKEEVEENNIEHGDRKESLQALSEKIKIYEKSVAEAKDKVLEYFAEKGITPELGKITGEIKAMAEKLAELKSGMNKTKISIIKTDEGEEIIFEEEDVGSKRIGSRCV